MMKKILLITMILVILTLTACTTPLQEVKQNQEKLLGETVTVEGMVKNPIKIGKLSGFTLVDGSTEMPVASDALPAENTKVKVQGVIMKEIIIGYYIQAKKIN